MWFCVFLAVSGKVASERACYCPARRESTRWHAEDRAFIESELREAQGACLTPIVITHHAPSPRCVRPWCEGDTLNAALASDLDPLIAQYQPPPLWVHGHVPGAAVRLGWLPQSTRRWRVPRRRIFRRVRAGLRSGLSVLRQAC